MGCGRAHEGARALPADARAVLLVQGSTRWRPASAGLPLRDIDVLLATDPFRRLRRVSITVYCRCHGSSDTDSEDEDEAEDEDDAIPSTEDAGDIEAMMDGSSGEDSHGVWFEQPVRESMPLCSTHELLQVRTQVRILKGATFLRRLRIPFDAMMMQLGR